MQHQLFLFFSMASHNKQDASRRKSPSGKISSPEYGSYSLLVNQKGRKPQTTAEGHLLRLTCISETIKL